MHQFAEWKPDQHRLDTEQVNGQQRFVTGANVSERQDTGDERDDNEQYADVVIHVRNKSLHRMRQAPDQQCYQDCQGYGGRHENESIREVWPANTNNSFEEHDVRCEKQHGDKQTDVPGITRKVLKAYTLLELVSGQRAAGNDGEAILYRTVFSWFRKISSRHLQ